MSIVSPDMLPIIPSHESLELLETLSTPDFLAYLQQCHIKLWVEGEKLRYSAPQGQMTSDIRNQLACRKPELLTLLHTAHSIAHTYLPPIIATARTSNTTIPASSAQQRLWFLHHLEANTNDAGTLAYTIPTALHMMGTLNTLALASSINAVVQRHESLRTAFHAEHGKPVQHIVPELTIPLAIHDLRSLSSDHRHTEALHQINTIVMQPFDIQTVPLLRATLFHLTADEYIFLLTMHHIITDAWSMDVFFRELSAMYRLFNTTNNAIDGVSGSSVLPPLRVQYADFSVWQQQWLTACVSDNTNMLPNQVAYWKKQLADSPALLPLPTDHPRPAMQSMRGATYRAVCSTPHAHAIRTWSQQEGVTLFMAHLALFAILLYRYTGQTDIVIGTPVANRTRSDIEYLIGFFVNTLALRVRLTPTITYHQLVQQVRDIALAAYANQDVPFEYVVDAVQPARTLSHHPLFQVMFVIEQPQSHTVQLPHVSIAPMDIHTNTAKFDLTLTVEEDGESLVSVWEYATDLFEAETIAYMAQHMAQLLHAVVEDPHAPIATLPLLTEAEYQRIVHTWNATDISYPLHLCLHELIAQQVERTPDAIAAWYDGNTLTYRELSHRANQLAHELQAYGVVPDTLVGLCVHRSLEMLVGLLAILTAGGAYVPIDPTYPHERIHVMLHDAGLSIVLTQHPLRDMLSAVIPPSTETQPTRLICIDAPDAAITAHPITPPTSNVTPTHLAYVIYTSGSTGTPKGAMNTHRAIVNRLLWMQDAYSLTPTDTVLQKTPISFDVAGWEFFWHLLVGARLVILPPDAHKDSRYLVDIIKAQRITTIHFVPSMLRMFLAEPRVEECTSLQRIICSGEALPVDVQNSCLSLLDANLYNLYGPTEAAIDVTHWTCQRHRANDTVPIGYPIANIRLYILDELRQPVPVGVSGELYIGGVGVARGYLNRPELTAERFVPDPFAAHTDPTARLYKTGDVVRYLPDGAIEFLGRRDYQVKIRGFRIELGEVEAQLAQHPDIREVAVVVRDDHTPNGMPANPTMVAYVSLVPGSSFTTHTTHAPHTILRAFLLERLPDYMVPSAFVVLEQLPLSPNGKLDRNALPAPHTSHTERKTEADYVAPRTHVEQQLAALWQTVLGIPTISIHDNFFVLGGHSLQALQLISEINNTFACNITVKELFLHPSIALFVDSLHDSLMLATPANGTPPHRTEQRSSPLTHSNREEEQLHHIASLLPTCLAKKRHSAKQPPNDPSKNHYLANEQRPLLSLIATGRMPTVQAATIGYFSSDMLSLLDTTYGISEQEIITEWYDGLPTCDGILTTHIGSIALIRLPIFDEKLYHNQQALVELIVQGIEMAHLMGARMVSLAGLLPSATNYGKAVEAVIAQNTTLPLMTTGHATTTSAVVLTIKRIMEESQRDIRQERVGLLGLGSIGIATLRLMLQVLPHPREILLCDMYSKHNILENIRYEIMTQCDVRCPVHIIETLGDVPEAFYDATMIVGATNVPDILDVAAIQPGTIIVDDSSPHCFNPLVAFERLQTHADILFTEGGVLYAPKPIHLTSYIPRLAAYRLPEVFRQEMFAQFLPHEITGCILSSLLSARFEYLKPTLGMVPTHVSKQHYVLLEELGFRGANLQCDGVALSPHDRARFRQHHSKIRV